jgi:hypothetical protein
MDRMIRITALMGLATLAVASAHAQVSYDYANFGAMDPSAPLYRPYTSSYSGFYLGPDGGLHSGTVSAYFMNLGRGVSMGLFTTVSNAPAINFSAFAGNNAFQSFGSVPTNYANGRYFDSAAGGPSSVSGQLSLGLGGGVSMNFLGGVSRSPGSEFYFGPGSGFNNRTYTTFGTGFSFDFGRGGKLSMSGSMSSASSGPRVYGAGFP